MKGDQKGGVGLAWDDHEIGVAAVDRMAPQRRHQVRAGLHPQALNLTQAAKAGHARQMSGQSRPCQTLGVAGGKKMKCASPELRATFP
jgi:hypothetical protein